MVGFKNTNITLALVGYESLHGQLGAVHLVGYPSSHRGIIVNLYSVVQFGIYQTGYQATSAGEVLSVSIVSSAVIVFRLYHDNLLISLSLAA